MLNLRSDQRRQRTYGQAIKTHDILSIADQPQEGLECLVLRHHGGGCDKWWDVSRYLRPDEKCDGSSIYRHPDRGYFQWSLVVT